MSSNSTKVLVLDFDGVIVDSNGIKDKVFYQLFCRFPEHTDTLMEYHRTYISVSRYEKFDFLLQQIGEPTNEALKEELLKDFSSITLSYMRTVPFLNGAKEFLEEVNSILPTYLASVTPIDDLEMILESLGIRSFFKDVYGCPPWTKPNAIRDILYKENIQPSFALLIGDSYGDQQAAFETGIKFIGRDSGLGFRDPQPTHIINDLIGFSNYFKK